jgi:7,8-dihydroneopterin aldolase/epimerase/oxygenase
VNHTIAIEGIRVHAYHGCLDEEARIGGEYIVDVYIGTDFSEAIKRDELNSTIDYCGVTEICLTEMKVRSKLIEHVCARIHNGLKARFPTIGPLRVKVTKLSPPIDGDVERVSVVIAD